MSLNAISLGAINSQLAPLGREFALLDELAYRFDDALLIAFDLGDELFYCQGLGGKECQDLLLVVGVCALLSALASKAVVANSARLRPLVAEVVLDDATTTLVLLVGVVE